MRSHVLILDESLRTTQMGLGDLLIMCSSDLRTAYATVCVLPARLVYKSDYFCGRLCFSIRRLDLHTPRDCVFSAREIACAGLFRTLRAFYFFACFT